MEKTLTLLPAPRLIVAVNEKMFTLIGWQIITCKSKSEFQNIFKDADFETEYNDSCDDYHFENVRVKLAKEDCLLTRHYPVTAEEGLVMVRKAEIMDIGIPGMQINNFDLRILFNAQKLYYDSDFLSKKDGNSNEYSSFNIVGFISDLKKHDVKVLTKNIFVELEIFPEEDDNGEIVKNQAWICSESSESDIYVPIIIDDIEKEETMLKWAFWMAAWKNYANCQISLQIVDYENEYADDLVQRIGKLVENYTKECFV